MSLGVELTDLSDKDPAPVVVDLIRDYGSGYLLIYTKDDDLLGMVEEHRGAHTKPEEEITL